MNTIGYTVFIENTNLTVKLRQEIVWDSTRKEWVLVGHPKIDEERG